MDFARHGAKSAAVGVNGLSRWLLPLYSQAVIGKFSTIAEYIAALPEAVRETAVEVREAIRIAAPHAEEAIRYDIPAFQMNGISFIYFAVWKKHIGLYPIYKGSDDFEDTIRNFRANKDAVRFTLDKPLPKELITRIVRSQLANLKSTTTLGKAAELG